MCACDCSTMWRTVPAAQTSAAQGALPMGSTSAAMLHRDLPHHEAAGSWKWRGAEPTGQCGCLSTALSP